MEIIYTKIDSRLWSDERFIDLSVDGKLLFIYALTCNHRNMIGLYSLPTLYAQADLGWANEQVCKGFDELLEKGFIKYNFKTNIIFIKNFLKYNPLENPNQVKGAIKAMETLPTSAINSELVEYLKTVDKPFIKPLIELLNKGLGKQEEEEEEEEEEVKEEVLPVELKFNEESIEYKLSNMLYQKILINDDKTKKPNLYKWAENIDKLIRLDKRSVNDIKSVINYATSDSFWMSNVLSTNKLRQQFPKLYLKVKEENNGSNGSKFKQNTRETEKYTKFNAEDAGVTSF